MEVRPGPVRGDGPSSWQLLGLLDLLPIKRGSGHSSASLPPLGSGLAKGAQLVCAETATPGFCRGGGAVGVKKKGRLTADRVLR